MSSLRQLNFRLIVNALYSKPDVVKSNRSSSRVIVESIFSPLSTSSVSMKFRLKKYSNSLVTTKRRGELVVVVVVVNLAKHVLYAFFRSTFSVESRNSLLFGSELVAA